VLCNNGTLGMVRQWQNLFYEKRFSATTLDFGPDFVKLAEAYGIRSERITTDDEFACAFESAVMERAPCLLDCKIDIDLPVLPMVPQGKPIDDVLLHVDY
jgi:acetolactate synthase-1/2/3 large subunit